MLVGLDTRANVAGAASSIALSISRLSSGDSLGRHAHVSGKVDTDDA
jgi:hypothetical protein